MVFFWVASISFLTGLTLIVSAPYHGALSAAHQTGPQKLHQGYTPRLAGLGIFAGLVMSYVLISQDTSFTRAALLAVIPLFIAGIAEDITARIAPVVRLVASLLTGMLFVWLSEVAISRTGVGFVDTILGIQGVAFVLTILAIAALSNAMNMIDGLNGLSHGTSLFMSIALGSIAVSEGDYSLSVFAFGLGSAIFGSLVLNFPSGRIFAGDGGAYLMGGMIAMLAILLVDRNDNISAFSVLLIILYPFYEMVRSITRRLLTHRDTMAPDRKHLHSLVFSLCARRWSRQVANPLAAIMVWIFPAGCCLAAVYFSASTAALSAGIGVFVIGYESASWMLKRQLSRKPS